MKLDENKVYSLEDLTSEEKVVLLKHMREVHGWKDNDIHTDLYFNVEDGWLYNMVNKVPDMTNAKELFYTLENVQVDCRELSDEHIKEMANVFEANGTPTEFNSLHKTSDCYYLHKGCDSCFVRYSDFNKTTITYEKFMELFGKEEVKMIAEEPKPEHYSKGIDTFARMEANCTTDECLAFAKGNIDKYNFRKKGQDLEDYKKIVSYANWAIKLLNKK